MWNTCAGSIIQQSFKKSDPLSTIFSFPNPNCVVRSLALAHIARSLTLARRLGHAPCIARITPSLLRYYALSLAQAHNPTLSPARSCLVQGSTSHALASLHSERVNHPLTVSLYRVRSLMTAAMQPSRLASLRKDNKSCR